MIHNPGYTTESPGKLLGAFQYPILPLASTRDSDFTIWGHGPDTRDCCAFQMLDLTLTGVRAMGNSTPIAKNVIGLVTENMVEIQELLNSLKFMLGLCRRITNYIHIVLGRVNTSNIGNFLILR